MRPPAVNYLIAFLLLLPASALAGGGGWSPRQLGARESGGGVSFRVVSRHATRIELCLFAKPRGEAERVRIPLDRSDEVWSTSVSKAKLGELGITGTVYYGYRAWGPNWPYDPAWQPGTATGFKADCDDQGHRFNPNKVLFDPYALELSHDPVGPEQPDVARVFTSGALGRNKDSARFAPKGIVLTPQAGTPGPTRPFKDEVIYEVHVRGLTMNDPSVPEELRGTYAGAALKAGYLKDLGVTAIELLPLHETTNDQNDLAEGADGDNYWGYLSLSWFAPDRRYAADKSPGGPTRELQQMVQAFHGAGLKVYVDVVYNHTGEGYLWSATDPKTANLLSWRGLDNKTYYQLADDARFYYDNTGIGGNANLANDLVREQVLDSLRYWQRVIGVDGYRFDLAVVLGNALDRGGFRFDKFDPNNALNRAVRELPVRPGEGGAGVDLIAEPWGIGDGAFQLGEFPSGWAEWNAKFRDTIREDINELGVANVPPGELARRLTGSSDLFGDDGRAPWHAVNFVVAHDGFTLHDLFAYTKKQNDQPWPWGPSVGGEDHNRSWDHGGDPQAQRQAARTALGLVFLAAGGVPMFTGGDEFLRTQRGNNNVYNLDSVGNWLDWSRAEEPEYKAFQSYVRGMLELRSGQPAFRPASWRTGADRDQDGLKDVAWYKADGNQALGGFWDAGDEHVLIYRLDAEEGEQPKGQTRSLLVLYNGWSEKVDVTLPAPGPGHVWRQAADTAAWAEKSNNVWGLEGQKLSANTYGVHGRSLVLLVERPGRRTMAGVLGGRLRAQAEEEVEDETRARPQARGATRALQESGTPR